MGVTKIRMNHEDVEVTPNANNSRSGRRLRLRLKKKNTSGFLIPTAQAVFFPAFTFAHLALCAAAIFRRAAAELR